MENDKFDEETRNNPAFDWLPVSTAICRLRSDRDLDNSRRFDYLRKIFKFGSKNT